MNKPFQRKDSESNTKVGSDFEKKVRIFFSKKGIQLTFGMSVFIGVNGRKLHKFDLGNEKIIVECKAHTWTEGDRVPSSKMRAWNEAMYLFYISPKTYRKIFLVIKDFSPRRGETLGQYYVRTYRHLIPKDVEIWEFDEKLGSAERINKGN